MSGPANHLRRRAAASLVELLVTMAIVTVVCGLVLVAVQASREAARGTQCQNNLRQISLAMRTFVENHKRAPAPAPVGTAGGWSIELLPYLEESNTARAIVNAPGLTSGTLTPQLTIRPEILSCPSASQGESKHAGIPVTHYAMELDRSITKVNARSQSWYVGDVAIDCRAAWPSGPEMQLLPRLLNTSRARGEHIKSGPHRDGFYVLSSWKEAVEFRPRAIPSVPQDD